MKGSVMRYVLRLSVTLFLITGLMAGVLGLVHGATAPKIAAAQAAKTKKALSAVLPDGENAQKLSEFPDETDLVEAVYASPAGYAVTVAPVGFDSPITMMVGVDPEGRVLGISVISHKETPNLGAVAADPGPKGQDFRSQYVGVSGAVCLEKDGGTLDAVTGATITSRAVTEGVNAALDCVRQLTQ